MMSFEVRVLLLLGGLANFFYVLRGIKKSKITISEAIFWFVISIIIVVFGIFNQVPIWIAQRLGIESPVNLVFLFFIAVLYIKIFQMALRISKLEIKLNELTSKIAIFSKKEEE